MLVFEGYVSGTNLLVPSANVDDLMLQICKQLYIHYKDCLGCLILDETVRPSFMGLKTVYTICLSIWKILMYDQVLLWLLTLHVYSTLFTFTASIKSLMMLTLLYVSLCVLCIHVFSFKKEVAIPCYDLHRIGIGNQIMNKGKPLKLNILPSALSLKKMY
jgi:hypothetical protein